MTRLIVIVLLCMTGVGIVPALILNGIWEAYENDDKKDTQEVK